MSNCTLTDRNTFVLDPPYCENKCSSRTNRSLGGRKNAHTQRFANAAGRRKTAIPADLCCMLSMFSSGGSYPAPAPARRLFFGRSAKVAEVDSRGSQSDRQPDDPVRLHGIAGVHKDSLGFVKRTAARGCKSHDGPGRVGRAVFAERHQVEVGYGRQ
jgi:hypothetical protein